MSYFRPGNRGVGRARLKPTTRRLSELSRGANRSRLALYFVRHAPRTTYLSRTKRTTSAGPASGFARAGFKTVCERMRDRFAVRESIIHYWAARRKNKSRDPTRSDVIQILGATRSLQPRVFAVRIITLNKSATDSNTVAVSRGFRLTLRKRRYELKIYLAWFAFYLRCAHRVSIIPPCILFPFQARYRDFRRSSRELLKARLFEIAIISSTSTVTYRTIKDQSTILHL